jgi:hypothetical protein
VGTDAEKLKIKKFKKKFQSSNFLRVNPFISFAYLVFKPPFGVVVGA